MSVTVMTTGRPVAPSPAHPGRLGRPSLSAVPGGGRSGFLDRAAQLGVHPDGLLSHGDLSVDIDVYEVRLGAAPLALSPRQVELLAVFLAAPGKVWSREQLHWVCWGDTAPSRRVDVQLCRIRGKVGLELFRNVRDRGWTLQQP